MSILRKEKMNPVKDKITSLYVYGSYLEQRESNDIDLFVISTNSFESKVDVAEHCKKVEEVRGYPTDWNIKTENEFEQRIHVNRPVTYFIGIKKRSILIFGEDRIKEVKESEIKESEIHKRVYEIAQRARHCYVNSRNVNFWNNKLRKRALSLISELLFLEGKVALNYKEALKEYVSHNPNDRDHLEVLVEDNITPKHLWLNLEKLLSRI